MGASSEVQTAALELCREEIGPRNRAACVREVVEMARGRVLGGLLGAGADLVVVTSPTFKGSYTGLLKVFLDRLPHRALAGTIALPLLVMGAPRHALAVEVHLRPLLVELGATVPTPGLAVLESQLDDLGGVLRP